MAKSGYHGRRENYLRFVWPFYGILIDILNRFAKPAINILFDIYFYVELSIEFFFLIIFFAKYVNIFLE